MKEINTLEEIKEIELSIMKEIHTFCEKNNLKYYLAYGTLIGAVRHSGFIPWDDDIDVWMFRDDYETFKKSFPKYGEKKGLYIAGKDTTPFYPRNMLKVCDGRTVLYEEMFQKQDTIGVFVDIWPLDGVSDHVLVRKVSNFFFRVFKKILTNGVTKKEYSTKSITSCLFSLLFKIIGIRNTLDFPDNIAKNVNRKSKYVECYAATPFFLNRIDYNEQILMKFQDSMFYVPKGYDRLLTTIYGDYMCLPPKELQIPHHIQNVFWK